LSVDDNEKATTMQINKAKFERVVKEAKARAAGDARWINAIDKAADGILSGAWIITELSHSYAITTESGKTYFVNGSCQCRAFELGQPCKHKAAARLLDLAAGAAKSAAPRITRSVESDRTGVKYAVTRCNGWVI
jgi:hypothetical protein